MLSTGGNLVSDPGFEQVTPGGKVPAGWQFSWNQTHSGDAQRGVEKQEPDFAIDEEETHGGRRSLWIGCARVRFERLMARAGKGRWTGPTEVLDDGTRTVSGRFKMPNGWTFDDYDRTRRLVADAILELDRLAKTPPAR